MPSSIVQVLQLGNFCVQGLPIERKIRASPGAPLDKQRTYSPTQPAGSRSDFNLAQTCRVTLIIYHRDEMEAVSLERGNTVIVGRDDPADVVVSDPYLSRTHARFELIGDEIWVEDLGSCNGVTVNGERVDRTKLFHGDELLMGSVMVGVHTNSPPEGLLQGLCSHDRLLSSLEEEVLRHRTFNRKLGLLMVRSPGADKKALARWVPQARRVLRPVDRMALYSPTAVLVAMPEVDAQELRQAAEAVVALGTMGGPRLLCGGALFPDSANTPHELLDAARTAVERTTPQIPVKLARGGASRQVTHGSEPVVASRAMAEVFNSLKRLASAAIPVLITGETGSGKEVVARAIHRGSPRRKGPFRCINCAAIPDHLMESVMFGHEKGAFTGADRRTDGVFLDASGGTVLLDEIGELSASGQAALLRVLDTRKVCRVGSSREQEVDVRVLAATHRDLEAMCKESAFRQDLLYRVNAMVLTVPPLRERLEEIEPLGMVFLKEANKVNGRDVMGFSPVALARLGRHSWPGNVRELRNMVHRAVVLAQGDLIELEDLPRGLQQQASAGRTMDDLPTGNEIFQAPPLDEDDYDDFKERVRRYEVELIKRALASCGYNQTEAAKKLRIPLRTLTYKIKSYGISTSPA